MPINATQLSLLISSTTKTDHRATKVTVNAGVQLGEAIRYASVTLPRRWPHRPRQQHRRTLDMALALNRKNALFTGSDEGGDNWAVIATLIENYKLSGINPHT